MANADPQARKRHWFLAVWSVPQVGHYVPSSAYVWSDKRSLSIPILTAAKEQRKLGDGAVLVNVSYVGHMTQYELTGTAPEPVASKTSPAYTLGLEQALLEQIASEVECPFPSNNPFDVQEWQAGAAQGFELREKLKKN